MERFWQKYLVLTNLVNIFVPVLGTELLHIVVVGQNFQSKCYFAKTLAEINRFRTFLCRRKLITTLDTNRTVKGHGIKVVITHTINTPRWTRQKQDIIKFKLKVLLYIEDNDCVDIAHDDYITRLHQTFQCKVLRVRHNMDQAQCVSEQSLEHGKGHVAVTDVTFCNRDSSKEKSEKVVKLLEMISDLIERQEVMFSGEKVVDDRNNMGSRSKDDDETRDHLKDIPELDSVANNDSNQPLFIENPIFKDK